ncbi:hypothetical protein FZC66_09190 [Priestia megaterium]|nr:hypothetical protein FZC66_09190 [Priestia megaterium]
MSKLFLEELKYIIQCEVPLTKYRLEQLQDKFDQSPALIFEMFELLFEKKHILLFVDDIESAVYDYLINREMANEKTFYGATVFVANLFGETPTYIKFKVNKYRTSVISNISA